MLIPSNIDWMRQYIDYILRYVAEKTLILLTVALKIFSIKIQFFFLIDISYPSNFTIFF